MLEQLATPGCFANDIDRSLSLYEMGNDTSPRTFRGLLSGSHQLSLEILPLCPI